MWQRFFMLGLIGLPSSACALADDRPDLQRVIEIIREMRAPIRDYECMYEGQQTRLITADASKFGEEIRLATERSPSMRAGYTEIFQGTFAYRDDVAAHLALSIKKPEVAQPMSSNIWAILRTKGSHRVIVLDHGGPVGPDAQKAANLVYLKNVGQSMISLDVTPYLQDQLKLANLKYFDPTWEDIDGFRCLAFSLTWVSNGKESPLSLRFWVDFAHTAVTRRMEMKTDHVLNNRLSDVKLAEKTTEDGKQVWFPVSGRFQWFLTDGQQSGRPYLEDTFEVLAGTLKINQGLKDERFSLDYGLDARTRELAREFNSGRRKPADSGPVSAPKAVAKALGSDNDPARRLRAQADPTSWIGRNGLALTFVTAGVGLLAGVGLWRRRAG